MKNKYLLLGLLLTSISASVAISSNNNLCDDSQNSNSKQFIFVTQEQINNEDNKDKTVVKVVLNSNSQTLNIYKPFYSQSDELYDGCMNQGCLFSEDLLKEPKILIINMQKEFLNNQGSNFLKLNKNLLGTILHFLDCDSLSKLRETCQFFAHSITFRNPWNFTKISWVGNKNSSAIEHYTDMCTIPGGDTKNKLQKFDLIPFYYCQITSLLPNPVKITVTECWEYFSVDDVKMKVGPYTTFLQNREALTFEKHQERYKENNSILGFHEKRLVDPYFCDLNSYTTLLCANKKLSHLLSDITIAYKDKLYTITPAAFKEEKSLLPRMLIIREGENNEVLITDFRLLSISEKNQFFQEFYLKNSEFMKKSHDTFSQKDSTQNN